MIKKSGEEEEYVNIGNLNYHALFLVGKRRRYGRKIKINNRISTYVYHYLIYELLKGCEGFHQLQNMK